MSVAESGENYQVSFSCFLLRLSHLAQCKVGCVAVVVVRTAPGYDPGLGLVDQSDTLHSLSFYFQFNSLIFQSHVTRFLDTIPQMDLNLTPP